MNNTADINIWIDYANADLEAAERLLNSPDPNNWTFLLTAWHCHQAIEKILKTVIVAKGKELLRIHDLGKLYSLTETQLDKEHVAFIENLNQYYIHSRYPDFLYPPLPKLDKEKTGQILQTTKHIYSTIKGRL